ncbi:MAG: TIM44-like domain-containing protein [Candidatus Riflebacteria bacterium]|nr:TIM44-like domain-containing protein [Candidatus Riflebacteria bacterium]
MRRLFSLLFLIIFCTGTSVLWARGGGGCLAPGTLIDCPSGKAAIESLRPGDTILAPGGIPKKVLGVTEFEAKEIYEIEHDVRATSEHPFLVAPGIYRTAARLGKSSPYSGKVYNLTVEPPGTFIANGHPTHNKGCFTPDTKVMLETGLETAMSALRPGDRVRAFTMDGRKVGAEIDRVFTLMAEEYFEVVTESGLLVRATAEHPFYVGDGTFRTVETLRPGDSIYSFRDNFARDRIKTIRRIKSPVQIFNIQTDSPNTFIAAGFAVHNKGGGCFPAGTGITMPNGDTRSIETLSPGDTILGGDGKPTTVRMVAMTRDEIIDVETSCSKTRTTMEHPFLNARYRYIEVMDFSPGSFLRKFGGTAEHVVSVIPSGIRDLVYEIEVDAPHSYIANGFIVHNKGSSGSGGYHSSGGHTGPPPTFLELMGILFFGLILMLLTFALVLMAKNPDGKGIDIIIPISTLQPRYNVTEKLVETISQRDPEFNVGNLKSIAEHAFRTLQTCWEERNYSEMAPLVFSALQKGHELQLQSSIRNHEINKIESLSIEGIWIVQVNHSREAKQREFSVLVQARAKDYFIDDRTSSYIRGDITAEQFQEFWVFQWKDGRYKVRDIEQTKDSSILSIPNRVEGMEDSAAGMSEISISGQTGKITKNISRMNASDQNWDQREMKEIARSAAITVYMARESGDTSSLAELATESFVSTLKAECNERSRSHESVEFRNICVRKVDICLARPAKDNGPDEFVARITLHAQRIKTSSGTVVFQDSDVTVFETMLRFERKNSPFRLAEIVKSSDQV